MGLSAGIVGQPNVGKSTLFNALCGGRALVENYPFTTIDQNSGVVAVPDDRLSRIACLCATQKVVPAFLELVDIAGLVKGASQGEGLGNQFLGHIKNVEAIVHVVRCFADEQVVHVEGTVDPLRDVSLIDTELALADLGTVERGIARVEKAARSGNKELADRLAAFRKAFEALSAGTSVRRMGAMSGELALLSELNLLTAKPLLYVANVDEDFVLSHNAASADLQRHADAEKAPLVRICAKIEAEIADLPAAERPEFLAGLGLDKSGLAALTQAVYRLLGLETFFTVSDKENRAWTVPSGTTAPKAAGIIHTDFEKGFIRAEVFSLADLEHYTSEAAIRAAGKVGLEGKDYIVQDGDIVFFRFNV